ncbi:MAG: shikimate kinase [Acidimicrobiia bacterium]|nr:shikimate kinase [Acidimicrobiia bacterium]
MMGSGKSETGRELARLMGRRFVDCDELVAAEAGRSIPEIFKAEGEAGFRRRESETLAGVLARGDAAVIATGGGVVTVAGNRALLDAAAVCWLRARPEVLAARVGDGSGRPMLASVAGDEGALGRLRRILADREPAYREVADIVVDVDDLSPGQAARAVAGRLGDVEGWLDGPCEAAS